MNLPTRPPVSALFNRLSTVAYSLPKTSVKLAAIDASAYLAFVPDCSPSINLANPCFCASFKAYLGNSPFPVTGAVPPVPSDGEELLVSVFPLEANKSTCLPLYIDPIIFDIAFDN